MSAINPAQVLRELNDYAGDLDMASKELVSVEVLLLDRSAEYEEHMAAYEQGLWEKHLQGAKLPPQELRQRMAHRAMAPELLGSYMALTNRRRRLQQRISTLKTTVDAKRSVVSALKAETEATGATGGR